MVPAITFGETACWRRPAATNRDPLESKAPLVEHLLLVDRAEASWLNPTSSVQLVYRCGL